ncbi:MAG: DUF1599 domain-containing protein [Cytophagales bacterium]|nr:MAG: DUF1599 domain-containing protein [Cytophagales bacterium]
MQANTLSDFRKIIANCQQIFNQKNRDYGTSWRILRLPSITDQLFIKAMRIRSIQEKGTQKVADDIKDEFFGIINYSLIALIQIQLQAETELKIDPQQLNELYSQEVEKNITLLQNKNHDYNEAWRMMRVSSMTDIILAKLLRIKEIENNEGKTLISEGVEAGYRDILNYAVFCLILLQ